MRWILVVVSTMIGCTFPALGASGPSSPLEAPTCHAVVAREPRPLLAVGCRNAEPAEVVVWHGDPALPTSRPWLRQRVTGTGPTIIAVDAATLAAAATGNLHVQLRALAPSALVWEGKATFVPVFDCDFEAGLCDSIWSAVTTPELCNGSDDDCDGTIDDGAPCSAGLSCCGGGCLDTASDPDHCNGCNLACSPPPNATRACVAGQCAIGACDPGFSDCNSQVADGCEVDPTIDPDNCGACGFSCPTLPNASRTCSNGACGLGACDPGFSDCNSQVTDGCEANTTTDPDHCGACGVACPSPPNATRACVSGQCALGACNAGFSDCNGLLVDGCEANITTDPNNCGTCGFSCPTLPNASRTCSNGTCGLGACDPGYSDCNGLPADGCEVFGSCPP